MSSMEDQLKEIKEELKRVQRKLDALIDADEDAQDFLNEETDISDELIDSALKVLVDYERASASLLQRRLAIGYKRALKLLNYFEKEGVVGPLVGSRPQEVLIKDPEEYWAKKRKN